MKKLNYTPGPWNVSGYTDEDTDLSVYADAKRIDTDGRVFQADWIADLCTENTCGGFVTTESNARLISAAPEMLEALINTATAMENWINSEEARFPVSEILDAIQKATGYTWEELQNG
jgi:hypothetical protein